MKIRRTTTPILSAAALVALAALAAMPTATASSASPAPTPVTGSPAPVPTNPQPDDGTEDSSIPEGVDDESLPGGITPRAGAGQHRVTVRVAADEEWRNQLGTKWKSVANTILEKADDRMQAEFGINVVVKEYVGYTSKDSLGDDECALLGDMTGKVGNNSKDIVVGFLGQGSFGGCAYLDGDHTVILRTNQVKEWQIARHEISHLFAAKDRYINVAGDNPNHVDDVMEDPYDNPNRWVSPDHGIIDNHAGKFD